MNRRPLAPHTSALPDCATPRFLFNIQKQHFYVQNLWRVRSNDSREGTTKHSICEKASQQHKLAVSETSNLFSSRRSLQYLSNSSQFRFKVVDNRFDFLLVKINFHLFPIALGQFLYFAPCPCDGVSILI